MLPKTQQNQSHPYNRCEIKQSAKSPAQKASQNQSLDEMGVNFNQGRGTYQSQINLSSHLIASTSNGTVNLTRSLTTPIKYANMTGGQPIVSNPISSQNRFVT